MPINIVVIEDDLLFLEQFITQLNSVEQVGDIYTFKTKAEAIQQMPSIKHDLAFVDINLPDGSGIEIIRYFNTNNYNTNFVVLTVFTDDAHLFDAIKAGAVGYLLKDEVTIDKIKQVIEDVKKGGSPISPMMAQKILNEFRKSYQIEPPQIQKLTAREKEVLGFLKDGHSAKEISTLLNISYHTVREHLKRIYKKLHVNSSLEAVAIYKNIK